MPLGHIEHAVLNGTHVFKFVGEVRAQVGCGLDQFLKRIDATEKLETAIVDLCQTEFLDSTILGIIAKLGLNIVNKTTNTPVLLCNNDEIRNLVDTCGLNQIYTTADCELDAPCCSLSVESFNTPECQQSLSELRQTVIDAHKTLMQLNPDNYQKFKNIVSQLEQEQQHVSGQTPPKQFF